MFRLPTKCENCPCYYEDFSDNNGGYNCNLLPHLVSPHERAKDCPLKTIEEHDNKIIEYTKEMVENGQHFCTIDGEVVTDEEFIKESVRMEEEK